MIQQARQLLANADKVVVGLGSGFSAAAGLRYDGPEFEREFADFIKQYGITDLYSSSFYPFKTEEEYWACWARHIDFIRYRPGALPLYQQLLELVRDKDYFVITTNVDGQISKVAFDPQRSFVVQGDYGELQCAQRCHDTLYDNQALVRQMVEQTRNCRIPPELVPRCPRCGHKMAVHVRVDGYFVEDEQWHDAQQRYADFLDSLDCNRVVLLELGVGFNTPTIIRFPFEKIAQALPDATLIRINRDNAACMFNLDNCLPIQRDIATTFQEIVS